MKKVKLLLLVIFLSFIMFVYFGITDKNWIQVSLSIILILILGYVHMLLQKEQGKWKVRQDQWQQDKSKLEKDLANMKNRFEEYDYLFNIFDGTTLYIHDVVSEKIKFSKGIENLLGRTQKEINAHSKLWKASVHRDDLGLVEEAELQLLQGFPIHKEFRLLHSEQGVKRILHVAKPIKNEEGQVTTIIGNFMDITKQKKLEAELKKMAFFDDLTEVPNRKMLDRHIQKAIARSRRHQYNLTLMFIDLDDFKIVNDTLGHEAGDQLLVEVVERLTECTREEDLISRLGGDEFIIVFEETSKEEIEDIANRIIKSVSLPYDIDGNEANISLSIGISMFPDDGEDKDTLIQNADKAMYFAKNNGKNRYEIYTKDLEEMEVDEGGIFKKWMTKLFG